MDRSKIALDTKAMREGATETAKKSSYISVSDWSDSKFLRITIRILWCKLIASNYLSHFIISFGPFLIDDFQNLKERQFRQVPSTACLRCQ